MLSRTTSSKSDFQGHEVPKKSLQIKQDNKFFSRLLSKETSIANSSCRVYYGEAAGAIPFRWESQPGTPKHASSGTSIPPLTPPPSYISKSSSNSKSNSKSGSTRKLLGSILFPKKTRKLSQGSSLFSDVSSSSSSSSSSFSGSINQKVENRQRCLLYSRRSSSTTSFDYGVECDSGSSPTSTLCFPVKKKSWDCGFGCYLLRN
ncbi:hypothetical protein UlMin_026179 [Ulmus minor]